MKLITLILITLSILACTNKKAQNTNSEPQDTIQNQQSTINSNENCPPVLRERAEPMVLSRMAKNGEGDSFLIPNSSFLIHKEVLLGKFNPAEDTNYVVIPDHMSTYKGLYCHREAFNAYLAMRDSALREGITLTIISATRTFDRQLQIWNRKWNSFKTRDTRHETRDTRHETRDVRLSTDIEKVRSIMRYSSMPGTSRHHWGTDIDFISAETDYWTHGEGLRIYKWLCANAHKFGFFQPYTDDPARTGYAEERWHWSYAPLSKPYLEAYRQKITAKDITGFSGSYLVDSLGIIQSHVFGITE
ncbi:MAG: M15 family metallopeptidase [Paludibacteraceae bacterium]|nr:M15 family metallopeptidase [Paludibacteraceae bacterium]